MNYHDYTWVPQMFEGLVFHEKGKMCIKCKVCGVTRQTHGKKQILSASESFKYCRKHRKDGYARFEQEDILSWPDNHKRCKRCLEVKTSDNFSANKGGLFGPASRCKQCRNNMSPRYGRLSYERQALNSARYRAAHQGIPFNLTIEDIVIPEVCPVLGVPLSKHRGEWNSPSLDKIIPERGYVRGNVVVMSKRANMLKNNMNLSEVHKLYTWMSQNCQLEAQ